MFNLARVCSYQWRDTSYTYYCCLVLRLHHSCSFLDSTRLDWCVPGAGTTPIHCSICCTVCLSGPRSVCVRADQSSPLLLSSSVWERVRSSSACLEDRERRSQGRIICVGFCVMGLLPGDGVCCIKYSAAS
jgi:hypothetical protein